MPEGHTIHRYARLHRASFGGQQVQTWSPQGRFTEGVERLNGSTLSGIDAYGKHLFYRFEPVGTLHVHLGLYGRFRTFTNDPPAPTPGTRLALRAQDGTTLYLAGASAVELIDDAMERSILQRLGPDPLRADADPEQFFAALRRRSVGIGQALLDQGAIAGVGNVYRAELMFLEGVHPDLRSRDVTSDLARRLWQRSTRLLRAGERAGRIVTVEAADRKKPPSRLARSEAVYVYKRAGLPCRRCGTAVQSWELGGRLVFACPQHQLHPDG